LRGVNSGFSNTPPSTIPSGPDVGISPHAVDQYSDWPAPEAVECHIEVKIFPLKNPPAMQPLTKLL